MLYDIGSGKAYLWHQPGRNHAVAKKKARELMANSPLPHGKLFMGPTGVDEMEFVDTVTLATGR